MNIYAGLKIREARKHKKITQRQLAHQINVSPTYMNLIENGKRPLGGQILSNICTVLELEPSQLSDDHDGFRAQQLLDTRFAQDSSLSSAQRLVIEQPEWVEIIFRMEHEIQNLRERLRGISDRIAYDHTLSQNLHDLLSHATSIRSTASILNTQGNLPPETTAQFRSVVHTEAIALSEELRRLVTHLDDQAKSQSIDIEHCHKLSQFIRDHQYYFEPLEALATSKNASAELCKWLEHNFGEVMASEPRVINLFKLFLRDIKAIKAKDFLSYGHECAWNIQALAYELDQPIDRVLRRLAMLANLAGLPRMDLQIIDHTGFPWLRIPIYDLSGTLELNCPYWPIFKVNNYMADLLIKDIEIDNNKTIRAMAAANHVPLTYNKPSIQIATMLTIHNDTAHPWSEMGLEAQRAGVNCLSCTVLDCANRRNHALFSKNKNN